MTNFFNVTMTWGCVLGIGKSNIGVILVPQVKETNLTLKLSVKSMFGRIHDEISKNNEKYIGLKQSSTGIEMHINITFVVNPNLAYLFFPKRLQPITIVAVCIISINVFEP
jgi:hypothetical protein